MYKIIHRFKSPIGEIAIAENINGNYIVMFAGDAYGRYYSPGLAAAAVANLKTGCKVWDNDSGAAFLSGLCNLEDLTGWDMAD